MKIKKDGFGKGRWNGFGGKVEDGESIEEAAKRELWEEAGITVPVMKKFGVLQLFYHNTQLHLEVHVFRAEEFSGEPGESSEMIPRWFAVEEIPYDQMWVNDRYWLPMLLAGKCFHGVFHFRNYDTLLEYTVKELATS